MFDLYKEQILDRSHAPQYGGHVDHATHMADGANRSCGDEVHIEIEVVDGTVQTIRHQTRACTICTASADFLAEAAEGKLVSELADWNSSTITELLGIQLSPTRLKCALLPLETLKEALKQA